MNQATEESAVDRATRITLDNWDALGIGEHNGVLYLSGEIRRRDAKGGVSVKQKIALRNVTNEHRFRCRKQARDYATKVDLDLDRDKDLVDQIENYAILAFAIRDPSPPYVQHVPDVNTLLGLYDDASLLEVWERYNIWLEMLDPRFGELTDEQLWLVISRIATEKTPGPLVDIVGSAQATCIVLMASLACSSPTAPAWLQSRGTSPPGS